MSDHLVLQTTNLDSLSTTESEYIALSQSLRDVIPLMGLLNELKKVFPSKQEVPTIHCTVFEDNRGCIELVKAPRMRPRTKHIGLKYHPFREPYTQQDHFY